MQQWLSSSVADGSQASEKWRRMVVGPDAMEGLQANWGTQAMKCHLCKVKISLPAATTFSIER